MDIETMETLLVLAAIIGAAIIAALVYFIPSIVAYRRNHKYTLPIFIANIFFGVTLFGWVLLLIFSILNEFKGEDESS